MIKAAYNFVPLELSNNYYSPKWKNQISQDIPLSDSVSGKMTLNITANTALFIKGEDGKFTNINNEEFIPGTSIKGCIRSVLEILSYGHLNEDRVQYKDGKNDLHFPYRNIDDRNGYMSKMVDIHCGWLVKDNGFYQVVDWGKPAEIRYREISRSLHIDENRLKSANSIPEKYKLTQEAFLNGNFIEDVDAIRNRQRHDRRRFFKKDSTGEYGVIVFTGFMTNKKSDFIFFAKNSIGYKNISENVFRDFKKLNPDFSKLPKYNGHNIIDGVPVFFTFDGQTIKTMGLSFLHRYYAQTSVCDAIPAEVKGLEPDLADVIFGSTLIKGRVQFGCAKKVSGELLRKENDPIKAVLNSPKASYFPTYLNSWNTWDSNGATILGRKRYPIKPNYDISPFIPVNENGVINENNISDLYPLKENASFKCNVQFHNLNKIELGALLSAITFHGRQNECKHSLGQAKSLGYGSVTIKICEIKMRDYHVDNLDSEIKTFLRLFEDEMNTYLGSNWINSTPIKELMAMAKGIPNEMLVDIFTSMLLESRDPEPVNEFSDARLKYLRDHEAFQPFTTILAQNTPVQSSVETKIETADAIVTFVNGSIIQAKLIEGKDTNKKTLKLDGGKKPKLGDRIQVKVIRKGGNVDYLIFKSIKA